MGVKPVPAWAAAIEPVKRITAASLLGLSRDQLAREIKGTSHFERRGSRYVFYPEHIAAIYRSLRDKGAAPIHQFEERYQTQLEAEGVAKQAAARREHYNNPIGQIYFVKADAFVKIGFTRDFKKRVRHIQTACPHPITILHVMAGHTADEKRLHERFDDLRHHGEWFRWTPALKAEIERLAAQTPRVALAASR